MPNYQDAKIYKIVNYENDDVYVGSTCEPTLARRLSGHVRDYKGYLNGKTHYITSFDVIATGNYDIQLIEAYPCANKMELHAREGYWIKQMECVNRHVAGRQRHESDKAYRENNRIEIAIRNKVYRETNKAKIDKYQKIYRDANKDKIKARYEKTKDKLNAKVECICGVTHIFQYRARHRRTKNHQKYINSIQYLQDIHEYVMSIIKKYK
jgi:hypothetical protein